MGILWLSVPEREGSKGSLAWGTLCSAHRRATLQAHLGTQPGRCHTFTWGSGAEQNNNQRPGSTSNKVTRRFSGDKILLPGLSHHVSKATEAL